MEFFIILTSVLVIVTNIQFGHCDIQTNINILSSTQNEARRLRNYPDNTEDPVLKAETDEAFFTTRNVANELRAILLFQAEVEANPDFTPLNCFQIHEHLLKIQTNISISEKRILKFASWNTLSTERIPFFEDKLTTASGNYTIIYTKLVTIYTQLKTVTEETFDPIEEFINLLNANADPVRSEISSKSSYCASFTYSEMSLHISDLSTTITTAQNLEKYQEPKNNSTLMAEIKWGVHDSQNLRTNLIGILKFQSDGIIEFQDGFSSSQMNCLQFNEYLTKLQTNISTNQAQIQNFESLPVRYFGRISHYQARLPSSTGNVLTIYTELISIFNDLTETVQKTSIALMSHLESLENFVNPIENEFQNRCPGFNQETNLNSGNFINSMTENQVIYPSGLPVSSNGLYELILLHDGNLVSRHRMTGEIVFSTSTSGLGGIKVVLQPNGVLAMLNENGDVVISTEAYSTPVAGSQLTLLNNGQFILSKDNQISFASQWTGPGGCDQTLDRNFYSIDFAYSVGTYYDGTPVYIGDAQFTSCQGRYLPARITTHGAYTICGQNIEQFEGSNDHFFYNHQNQTLIDVDFQNLSNYIRYFTAGDSYVGVVVQVSSPTKGNFTTVGRYSTAAGGVVYWDGDAEVLATSGTFGVLHCETDY